MMHSQLLWSIWKCLAKVQGGGTGGLSFFDTIYKAATWPIETPHQDMNSAIVASPSMSPGQGGLVATISDLHHEHHTARPELYVPKVGSSCCRVCCIVLYFC